MHNYYLFLFQILWASAVMAQTLPEPRELASASGPTVSETVIGVGRLFLGKPYVPHTLDKSDTEQLVVNVGEFDCTTFVETAMALTLAWHEVADKKNGPQIETLFRKQLTRIRYRNGQIDGYASRLHYFSEWLRDNERKGILQDVTSLLTGHVRVSKPLSYMTAKTHKYPALQNPAVYKQIAQIETALSQERFAFVPKKNLRQAENNLRDGDIIMLTASRPGLDMKHCGFAVWQNGRVHLLHASSDLGRVVLTSQPLTEYVLANRWLSGIRVARFKPAGSPLTASAE
ncbi:DUF1460 domain-containing protein [Rudanella paleaurantiibacter]|uniref:DUF1460 domain-containing protein n=1 Tax=Rudanella paleaurantiibacter TaxID=2614655 RepID=A0A7J5TU84_9BACT|nr:N-acetylmuramoyl-L-alanine amidase-like domain-containing protein [Rudanella paleaurantiibacter]KAB7727541.1 DUF1460 domain-containing protein [Rudanella paleaurantiibacter]